MNNFLDKMYKKNVSNEIRWCNKEKKLKKAEQASLNQDQESSTFSFKKISKLSNPMTEILQC